MHDTAEIRQKMLEIWEKIDKGKMTAAEARIHIGLARAILDTLKVEIAAAHLNTAHVPAVSLSSKPLRMINRKAA